MTKKNFKNVKINPYNEISKTKILPFFLSRGNSAKLCNTWDLSGRYISKAGINIKLFYKFQKNQSKLVAVTSLYCNA